MIRNSRCLIARAMALGAAVALAHPAAAQLAPGPATATQSRPAATAPQALAQSPAQPPAKQPPQAKRPASPGPESHAGSDGPLRQRVEQLEEQLVDLQVVIGTLESLARSGGTATASAAYRGGAPVGGPESGRIAALETQVQALVSQVEQMSEQIRQLRAGGAQPAPRAGFGATTVTPAAGDPIAGLIAGADARPAGRTPALAPGPGPGPAAAAAGFGSAASPVARQQYESAYSQLLQQNYPAAEVGFTEFVQQFPSDELAPNAQFWLGETFFVRGQWDSAAAAFLKVAQNYGRSDKAPDSLAKFAMAMGRKGNKQAACRALAELNSRYPNPPAHVKAWDAAERRSAGCV